MNKKRFQSYGPICLYAILFLLAVVLVDSNYYLSLFSQAAIYTILAVSLQLIFGYAGQVSLAQAGFFGIGAYTSAILTLHLDVHFLVAFLLSGIAAALASIILSPMAKLSEIYFAMSTFAFNLILTILFANGGSWTGGWNGLTNIPYPDILGWSVDSKKEFFILASILLIVQYVFMVRLTEGRLGRNFRAIRDNQLAAASVGINIGATKTKGFVIGCFWAGLAGSVMVHMYAFISPEPFQFIESITVILMVVLGGLGSFTGALLGGFGVTFFNEFLKEIPLYRPIIYGASIVLMMIFWPNGLYGLLQKWLKTAKGRMPSVKSAVNLKQILSRSKAENNEILKLEQLTKQFGGIKALTDVSLQVRSGEIFGLIGPNGAGKTTFINMVTGLERPTSGKIFFQQKEITGKSMNELSSMGMVRTFQTSKLFESMTVLENVTAGMSSKLKNDVGMALLQNQKFRAEEEHAVNVAYQLIKLTGLEDKAFELCANLSYGHRRLAEIARALASQPEILFLDEPAAGLNLKEREQLQALILRLRDEFGMTIFIVEHDLNLLSNICDHMAVLNFGVKIADGSPEEVMRNPDVVQAYLGRRDKKHA
ncbi:branched-chain amino acid ABC transporter ATP-binding protein/permease [Brevibacillus brevis]|uniref:Branched-chain amino acid ABC transporter ATP-binding protein/permease n=1 Tax=Brevibacillus brevis TaxID=1393 RepID=A0ABY9T5S5_BREBE|nr:branched-chain amino acid ABC transporter ATP-binding protein/permease [Brevibacillus brevis]WNC15451.1 branched-chain amino acid ABC transporter ATP-binding protein/permease [Brevibacillus brevis]